MYFLPRWAVTGVLPGNPELKTIQLAKSKNSLQGDHNLAQTTPATKWKEKHQKSP